MLLEFFNLINNITPVLSTTTQTTLTLSNNNISLFANILLISKLILLIISISYLSYLYFYKNMEIKNDYIPHILIQYSIINLLLLITFFYTAYQYYFNPPKKNI
jgi:phosphoglycerol transferase MdoB-like AlkP superfamily enzyme